ncbi:hypothetical protein RHOFW510R12_01360 [Rhodanobacter sp. FW510-R12]|uniref:hypothetical protein n=1 Tax=unclassified Rhodanobacter TaxID=2621553 RepID=UPI0007A998D1|nr:MULTISPECIES: hypothetical protein [unclassified Rhodanobacter]KZC17048.1 hypothetical protein RHOFW104R8_13485 [Rhodanobacter sp. FW104-R8]KZC28572.1 hypothetical protein RhoFW510T8_10725 [Rhodanobacter sp. FW510-T8]KZC32326.1 hypothetical protein RhoFW510R10_12905 [Rhodanobacter sp. FW510-R10]
MSERIKDGGPAFPATNYYIIPKDLEDRHVAALGKTQGMTLRDYFAAKAMQGVIAQACGTALGSDPKYAADYAYAAADAMLAAREAKS